MERRLTGSVSVPAPNNPPVWWSERDRGHECFPDGSDDAGLCLSSSRSRAPWLPCKCHRCAALARTAGVIRGKCITSAGRERTGLMGLFDSSNDLVAMKNFNNQPVSGTVNGGNTVTFSAADATTPQPITLANVPTIGYETPPDVTASINGLLADGDGATQYAELLDGVPQSGDYHYIESDAYRSSESQPSLVSAVYPTSGGPVTISFPAPWSTKGPTPASLPTFLFDYTGYAGKSGVLYGGELAWTPADGSFVQDLIDISATQSYLGAATSLTVPDLSGSDASPAPPALATFPATTLWNQRFLERNHIPGNLSICQYKGGRGRFACIRPGHLHGAVIRADFDPEEG